MHGVPWARTAAALCAAGGAALAAASPAAAHLRTGTVAVDYGASVTSPRPATGAPFSVGVYQSDRALHLTVRRGHTVVVLGYLGEPFLRVDAAGVWIDARSPTAAAVGLVAGTRATGWRLERGRRSVVWHDGRVQGLPPGARRAGWRIPIVVDGRRSSIAGEVWRVPSPALWPWLAVAAAVAAAGLAVAFGAGRVRLVAVTLGLASSACALLAAGGFALSRYASPGTWIAGVDEALFALAGAAVVAWGPRAARPAAGAGVGLLGVAVGLSKGAVFLHPIVLSALPGTVTRALVAVAVGAGVAAAVAGAVLYARLEEPLARGLAIR